LGGSSYLVGGCSDAAFRCQQPNAESEKLPMQSVTRAECFLSELPHCRRQCLYEVHSNTVYQSQYCDGIAYRDWSYASTAAAD